MTLTKLNGNESGVIIAKLINALIDEKASIDLSDLDATGEQRFTDLSTAISTLNTALSTLTTTVNKKVEATVSLAANGYIKFDKGEIGNYPLLIQWGTGTMPRNELTQMQAYNISYNYVYIVICIHKGSSEKCHYTVDYNPNYFIPHVSEAYTANRTYAWFAVGSTL